MIAVLGAMDGEIAEFLNHTEGMTQLEWRGFRFYLGKLEGKDVLVAKSGVGKVLSALFTQRLIDQFQPESIIFTGLAGGLSECTDIGDTVIGKDCLQHDFDVTALGFKRGEIPYSPYHIIKADSRLVEIAAAHEPLKGKVIVGRIITGDQFLTCSSFASHRYLVDELSGDAVEMEGASVGLVATVNEIPFVIIRTISDKTNEKAHVDFRKFLPIASQNSYLFVKHILQNL